MICKRLLPIFCKIFCTKHFLQKKYVRNTCEIYNFVENNYPLCQLKILEKIKRKYFLTKIL